MWVPTCYAYHIIPGKKQHFCVDISHYGVRQNWGPEAISDVARREIKNHYGRVATCWRFEMRWV